MKKVTFGFAMAAALAFAVVGCGDDAEDGTGGTGGTGATGGTGGAGGAGGTGGAEMAMVRVAHLAPDVPTMADTNVDILVDGPVTTTIEDLQFAEATGFVSLPPGEYTFGIAVAGETVPVFEFNATLVPSTIATVVAIRTDVSTSGTDLVNVLVFDGSTDGLAAGSGRVLVGHGADDTGLAAVDVINNDACPPALVEDLLFGTVQNVADLPEASYNVAIAAPASCVAAAGPLVAPVTADVATLLVAVDTDPTGPVLAPAVYALIDDFSGDDIPTLQPTP
jgi:hypothetical protein